MATENQPLISLIIPVHNEAGNLAWHHEKILAYMDSQKISHEIIYIDDGSTDESLTILKDFSRQNPRVHFLSFSKNFGKEAATSAGLKRCTGQAAIMIDADGQHPVELVGEFITKWQEGFSVVIGVRTANTKEGFVKRYGSWLFNVMLNAMTAGNTVRNSTDFRLIDRKVIDEFNKLTERGRVTRGLIDWLGFKRGYVDFKAPARHSGEASYSIRKLTKLAIHGFVAQSTKPLQLTGLLGGLVMFTSALITIFLLIEKYVLGDPLNLAVTGSAILAIFLSFLIGMVLICQWLLALYIESIHNETQNRPLFIVAEED